jgi:hypothetical protein
MAAFQPNHGRTDVAVGLALRLLSTLNGGNSFAQ